MSNQSSALKSTVIYGIGRLVGGFASFITLPIYTKNLSPADYGVVELLVLLIELAALLIGAKITAGMFRFYSEAQSEQEKKSIFSSTLYFISILFCVAIAVIWLLADPIESHLGIQEQGWLVRIFSFTLLISGCNELFFAMLRIKNRPITFVSLNIGKLALQVIFCLLFIWHLKLGYWGVVYASILSNLALSCYFAFVSSNFLSRTLDLKFIKALYQFSWPIIISSFGMYLITFGDRYFINTYLNTEAVGIYALAYKFGLLLFSLIWSPFAMYWEPQQYSYAKQESANELFGSVFCSVSIVVLLAAGGLINVSPLLIQVIADPAYQSAIAYVPFIVLAYVFHAWSDFMRFGLLKSGKTIHITYATYLSVAAILVLFMLLIPSYGLLGASIATLSCFVIRFSYIAIMGNKYFSIKVPVFKLVFLILYSASICLMTQQLHLTGWVGILAIMGIYFIALLLLLVFPWMSQERDYLKPIIINNKLYKRFIKQSSLS